jgi:hypothetical protein
VLLPNTERGLPESSRRVAEKRVAKTGTAKCESQDCGLESASEVAPRHYLPQVAVLNILKATEGDEGLDMRWRIALLGVDRFLTDCGMGLETK